MYVCMHVVLEGHLSSSTYIISEVKYLRHDIAHKCFVSTLLLFYIFLLFFIERNISITYCVSTQCLLLYVSSSLVSCIYVCCLKFLSSLNIFLFLLSLLLLLLLLLFWMMFKILCHNSGYHTHFFSSFF